MSRGQDPRTPVYFPKMKVRGRRNRARSALRLQTHGQIRVNILGTKPDGSVSFEAHAYGTHFIKYRSSTTDGWGRVVSTSPPPIPPASNKTVAAMEFKLLNDAANRTLLDLLAGKF